MQQFLIFIISFLDFWFYPFLILFAVSFVIEQIIRRSQSSELNIMRAMSIRKFLFRQNLILNFSWFAVVLLLAIVNKGSSPTVNSDLVWDGY
ncbi:MAG: hypothetical protein CM15mL4_0930 [uncultured marine virus]|jgi:preprotein translocase subunit SecG|nr:MAG: hypothetical protein CM15mL4_0930 [uncultured marine virus]